MSDTLSREDFKNIFEMGSYVLGGEVYDEPLENIVEREYGTFGSMAALPWCFECAEKQISANRAIDMVFGDEDEITEIELYKAVAGFSEQTVSFPKPNPELKPLVVEEDEEVSVPVTTMSNNMSFSAKVKYRYRELFNTNPHIRNKDAIDIVAVELGFGDDLKKRNSMRALVTSEKKALKNA